MSDGRHENYEILNLIGYGLAKFDMELVQAFGFHTKTAFYKENKRKGWWQKGNAYLHRKTLIDSLFINFNASEFANVIKLYIKDKLGGQTKPYL